MKAALKQMLVIALSFVLAYLVGAVFSSDFDTYKWNDFILYGSFFFGLFLSIYFMLVTE